MIEKYSCYEFEIFSGNINCYGIETHVYYYEIYAEGYNHRKDGFIKPVEYYESEQEARFAAIGHIDNLENGDTKCI